MRSPLGEATVKNKKIGFVSRLCDDCRVVCGKEVAESNLGQSLISLLSAAK